MIIDPQLKTRAQVLRSYGGFVRYYDSTEPLLELAGLCAEGACRDVLCCCGGGDQALTMLGACWGIGTFCAIDINPAQLFILAAKAEFLANRKTAPFLPALDQVMRSYPLKIKPVQRDIRPLLFMYHLPSGKRISAPKVLARKYAVIHDEGVLAAVEPAAFWSKDKHFSSQVRGNLPTLRFLRADILESPQHFKKASLDVIYFSDIYWQGMTQYHVEQMKAVLSLLRPEGRIISYVDPGEDYDGAGVSPAQLLAKHARQWSLNVKQYDSGYLVIQKKGRF